MPFLLLLLLHCLPVTGFRPLASDYSCSPCSVRPCPSGTFQSDLCSAAEDRVCTTCAPFCPPGQFIAAACTPVRVCARVYVCVIGCVYVFDCEYVCVCVCARCYCRLFLRS